VDDYYKDMEVPMIRANGEEDREAMIEIKAPLRRISLKYQLGRLRGHEQRSPRIYSTDSLMGTTSIIKGSERGREK
jgi:hypothetical protein